MIQELIITVESDKPLSAYGEGHMIIYDSRKKTYYVQDRETFLLPQNEQIKLLKKDMFELNKKNIEFKNDINKKLDEFLKTYQEANTKLIKMVEEVVIGGK